MAAVYAVYAVYAAAEVPPGLTDLAQYGPLGILCLALLWFAWWVIRSDRSRAETFSADVWQREQAALQREIERGNRLEAEVNRLNGYIQETAIPAVLAGTRAVTEATELLRDERRGRIRRNGDDS